MEELDKPLSIINFFQTSRINHNKRKREFQNINVFIRGWNKNSYYFARVSIAGTKQQSMGQKSYFYVVGRSLPK